MKIEGQKYRCVDNWYGIVPDPEGSINYLEIGAFCGANVISCAESCYGKYDGSKLYCVDPWEDYEEYNEYKGEQEKIYDIFCRNIKNNGVDDKIEVRRGYSRDEIVKFGDNFFDIIYIDGNHEPEYIMEDAVLSFRKLKKGGYMIFDDYGWEDASYGIDGFLNGYRKRYEMIHPNHNTQVFIRKII